MHYSGLGLMHPLRGYAETLGENSFFQAYGRHVVRLVTGALRTRTKSFGVRVMRFPLGVLFIRNPRQTYLAILLGILTTVAGCSVTP